MRQAFAKATRREIRRAIGTEAVQTIADHEQGVRWCVAHIQSLHADLTTLAADHALLKQHLARPWWRRVFTR